MIETLVSLIITGIVILVIVFFFSGGIKDYMQTVRKPQVKAQEIVRETMSGRVGDKRGGMLKEMRNLMGLSFADRRNITFVLNFGERYADINSNGKFESNEAIIFDEDGNFSYEQGTDTVKTGSSPPEGTPLLNFYNLEKHSDEGENNYKFDSGETVIRDLNDNNQYDTGEEVLVGGVLANATKLVPFGNTITYELDIANKEINRLENGTHTEIVADNILVDAVNNSFGLEFRYFDTNGAELAYLPLSLSDKQVVCFIGIRIATDVDDDQKSDFELKTRVFLRKLMK